MLLVLRVLLVLLVDTAGHFGAAGAGLALGAGVNAWSKGAWPPSGRPTASSARPFATHLPPHRSRTANCCFAGASSPCTAGRRLHGGPTFPVGHRQ